MCAEWVAAANAWLLAQLLDEWQQHMQQPHEIRVLWLEGLLPESIATMSWGLDMPVPCSRSQLGLA